MDKKKIISMTTNLTKTADTNSGRNKIINGFSKKIKNFKGDNTLLEQVKKLYRYFVDPNTNKSKKALIGAGLLYFIMPIDVVNDFIPGLGFLDDGVAIAYVISLVDKEIREYEKSESVIDVIDNEELIIKDK